MVFMNGLLLNVSLKFSSTRLLRIDFAKIELTLRMVNQSCPLHCLFELSENDDPF